MTTGKGFTRATWHKASAFIIGIILFPTRRTITAALKQMDPDAELGFTLFNQVLIRVYWSCFDLGRALLQLLVSAFVGGGDKIEIVIDETWGVSGRS